MHNLLKDVWESIRILKNKKYQYYLSYAMFYFYNIAHIAKHFETNGCSIGPFIDLWILDGIEGVKTQKCNELLIKGDLIKFTEAVRSLSRVSFDNVEHTE